jgi:hypothetical protein
MKFRHNSEHDVYDFLIDRDRIYSSILEGGTGETTPYTQLARLCTIRTMAWADEPMRLWLDELIEQWHLQYPELRLSSAWALAMTNLLSDNAHRALRYGQQPGTKSAQPTADKERKQSAPYSTTIPTFGDVVRSALSGPELPEAASKALNDGFVSAVDKAVHVIT